MIGEPGASTADLAGANSLAGVGPGAHLAAGAGGGGGGISELKNHLQTTENLGGANSESETANGANGDSGNNAAAAAAGSKTDMMMVNQALPDVRLVSSSLVTAAIPDIVFLLT